MIDAKLVTFITVARMKNLTKAADVLNITQPAISQHIKSLEDYYNVKLLYKKNRKMELTEEGKMLFESALELERLSKMIKLKLENKSAIIKKYRVGATLTIGGYILPEIIGRCRRVYENLDIVLEVENTETIIKRLFNGDINIGVIEGPFNRADVKYEKFMDDELVLAVSPEHRFAKGQSVKIDEVLKDKLILREKGSGTRMVFEDYLKKQGYSLDESSIYMEIGNITALISLVESNLGCTIVSKQAVKASLKAGTLKIVPIENFKMLREFNFIYLEDINKDFIENFISFCKGQ